MARSKQLVDALKIELKRHGMTYKVLAGMLDVSESTVKQMFSSGNFTLKRLDAICELLDSDLTSLLEISESIENKLSKLNLEQERALIQNKKLLVVAYCLVNYWSVEEILERYLIDPLEMITLLAKLDKMKLIELLPSNKVRLLMANNFHWQKNGPIEKYFREQVQTEFFNTDFSDDGALRVVKNGIISKKGQLDLHHRLKMIDNLFDEVSQQERRLPLKDREGVTMILAIRSWQLSIFDDLERD